MASKYVELKDPTASQRIGATEKSLLTSAEYASTKKTKQSCISVCMQQKLTIVLVAIVSSLGGLLLGYDLATFSFPVVDTQLYFSISETWKQILVYVPPIFASISALSGAIASRPYGYRPLVLTGSAVFAVGTAVNVSSVNGIMLFVGRTMAAIGLGLVITIGPVYAAEVSPAEHRGKVITVQGQLIAVGGSLSYLFVGYLGSLVQSAWPMRLGFVLMGTAAVVMFVAFLYFPESYRWLARKDCEDKARDSLRFFLKDPDEVRDMLERVQELMQKEKPSTGTLPDYILKGQALILAFIVGQGLTVITQLCLTIRVYVEKLESPWVTEGMPAYWVMKVLLEIAPVAVPSVGLALVDRIGRRWVLVISLGGITASLLLLFGASTVINDNGPGATPLYNDTCVYMTCGACVSDPGCGYCTNSSDILYSNGTCSPGYTNFDNTSSDMNNGSKCTLFQEEAFLDLTNQTDLTTNDTLWSYFLCPTTNGGYAWFALLSVLAYRAFFFFGIQNVLWTVNTEIYPTNSRAIPLGVVNAVYLISNGVLNILADAHTTLALPYMYLIFAALTLLSTIFVRALLPETKNTELENTGNLFEWTKLNSCLANKFSGSTVLPDLASQGNQNGDLETTD